MSLTNGVGGNKKEENKKWEGSKDNEPILDETDLTIMMSVFADNSNNNEIPLIKHLLSPKT